MDDQAEVRFAVMKRAALPRGKEASKIVDHGAESARRKSAPHDCEQERSIGPQ
jgi:hypothetical protein